MNGKTKLKGTISVAEMVDLNPNRIELSRAQQKYLNRLVNQMGRMEGELKTAQERRDDIVKAAQVAVENAQANFDLAQVNANEYLFVCAEDVGIVMGEDGWEFIQTQMSFVREVVKQVSQVLGPETIDGASEE